jgi:hypothetical protein
VGTSTSFAQLAGKLDRVAANIEAARQASFRQAERDMQPLFNRQARAAAGGDQALSNAKNRGRLKANFKVRNGSSLSELEIRPAGPWGLRDNTDVGGSTGSHTIRAKRAKMLHFTSQRTGKAVFAKSVEHPGSSRAPFWGEARDEAYTRVRTRIPRDVADAIEAALNGARFSTRP